MAELTVLDQKISYFKIEDEDYISITDMLKSKDGDFFVSDWLRNRNTIEFLGIWEEIHNPNFNYGEFAIIKSQAGLNSYKISVKEWVEKTNAIGIMSKAGRYGGTYAHSDIAFEFASWVSAEFKLYIIKDYKRLNYGRTDFAEWTDCSSDRKFILQIPEARGCKLWISKDGKVLQMYGDAILQK